ncbi:5'-adenylylsulfate reductase-like 3 [Nymphaea thermarum]|nr:5'-adenylylsulfate reductase-like 3 [Nymphaea thermarum]
MLRRRMPREMRFVLGWMLGFAFLLTPLKVSSAPVCPAISASEMVVLGLTHSCLPEDSEFRPAYGGDGRNVMELDEVSLQRALNLIHRNSDNYVAMIFHASWCPFSKTSMPVFVILSSLFPTIHHIAVEESAVRPSLLSRYGVHGFPTLFLQNSTTRLRYRGSRTFSSVLAFYVDVTGIKPSSPELSPEKVKDLLNLTKAVMDAETEYCPFSWAKSPEKLLQQETYLALAISFLALRLLYFLLPRLLAGTKCFWERYVQGRGVAIHWERLQAYREQAVYIFGYMLCIPRLCKGSNLQGGAMNARAWASKSLACVHR